MKIIYQNIIPRILNISFSGFKFIPHYVEDEQVESIFIMESQGRAICRIYWYKDDDSTVYLNDLHVDRSFRRKGIGTKLQDLREEIGYLMGAKTSCLSVDSRSWMYEWYIRKGYQYYADREDRKGFVWMQKLLKEKYEKTTD